MSTTTYVFMENWRKLLQNYCQRRHNKPSDIYSSIIYIFILFISDSAEIEHDEGFNRVVQQLPLMEVTIKQRPDPASVSSGNLTLGPLVCWGNSE